MATTSDMHLDDVFYKKADDFFAANAGTGLTYDDVSLATCFSDVLPRMTRLDTTISDRIALSLPIMSADMDTVTESTMAIAMALHGGIGMIHYNMTNADQVAKVRRVKTYIHGMIDRPATVPADLTVGDVLEMIERNDYNFSTFPVTDAKGKLLGLLRGGVVKSRHAAHKVSDVMIPREQVLTIQEKDLGGDPIATADRIFLEHIGTNKILVVDAKDHLRGLFTLSDIERIRDESGTDAIRPSRDENFRLRCGASVAVPRYPDGRVNYDALNAHVADLVGAGADAVIISTAHGHSAGVGECVRFVRDHFKDLTIIAGNVTSGEGVEFLAEAGADSVKIGQGPGSICSTRIVAGVGTVCFVQCRAGAVCVLEIFLVNCGIVIIRHKIGDVCNILAQDNFAIFIDIAFGWVQTFCISLATDHFVGHACIQCRDTALGIVLIFVLHDGQARFLQHQVRTAHIGHQGFVHFVQTLFVRNTIAINRQIIVRRNLVNIGTGLFTLFQNDIATVLGRVIQAFTAQV